REPFPERACLGTGLDVEQALVDEPECLNSGNGRRSLGPVQDLRNEALPVPEQRQPDPYFYRPRIKRLLIYLLLLGANHNDSGLPNTQVGARVPEDHDVGHADRLVADLHRLDPNLGLVGLIDRRGAYTNVTGVLPARVVYRPTLDVLRPR